MEKANNTQTYTMTYKKINKHTQIHNLVISLRETVQFMCVMKIKVNTQKIHTMKKNTSRIIM